MRIGVDLDGVLAEHVSHLLEYLRKRTLISGDLTKSSITHWDYEILGRKFKDVFEEHLKLADFVESMPTVEGAVESVNELYKKHYICIVTARPNYSYESTLKWLLSNGFKYHDFVCNVGLGRIELNIDVLIDDSPTYTLGFVKKGKIAILFDQPWNRNLDPEFDGYANIKLYRCKGWDEIVGLLNKLGSITK